MPNTIHRDQLDALAWRCIGPPRGGRVVAVAGDPVHRQTFYFGACAGGIWKTTDAGTYWRCVSDGFLTTAAIGALAVAPSDPNVIYAGTGETEIRIDVSYGDGLYKSDDAGRTWRHCGLRDSKHIGTIVIHPRNPDIAFAAALGDIFGPNDTRGLYRTTNGGQTWDRVLHRDENTGAIDVTIDPNNPRILFAALWQARRSFWNLNSGGPGCGLFRSTDAGDTWQEITRNPGLPDGLLGKIGVSLSPARPGRVWALVEALEDKTGLYRSDDNGDSFKLVCASRDLMHRPWYYTHVTADPAHPETVYVNNLQLWRSTDGGVTFSEIHTPHGDNHDIWIDPANPQRMIQGNDGGANVSFNGGETWSSIYNQKTAQFYRIATDNQYPYNVYGTQQDNTAIACPSATIWGAITLGDCFYPGSGESGFIAVKPDDDDVVFHGAIGSSPGGAGALQRWDRRENQIRLVNVWPEENTGIAPRDLRYRFAWTFPIAFSPHDPNLLYAAGNHVFRTTDDGTTWQQISPDLSLDDKSRQGHSGGDVTRESAGAEIHATCACIAESPHRRGEIWATTDDGLVHVTADGGVTWRNVTPHAMPALAYVGCVELSAHDAETVYLSATCYKLADYHPYLFRTRDGGQTWDTIAGDLPGNEITRVIRADPEAPGLLFVGTETGIHFSMDDGAHWQRIPGKFPVCPVYDLKLKGADLVVGTHGRSFWIMDDITPLRTLADGSTETRLVPPRPAIRNKLHFGASRGARTGITTALAFGLGGGVANVERPDGSRTREYLDIGENPPQGALLHYYLAPGHDGPVVLTIGDAAGRDIVTFRSDDETPGAKRPATNPGLNRFLWDLKHPGPVPIDKDLAAKTGALAADGDPPSGPVAVPGTYTVTLTAAGKTYAVPLTIAPDPRLKTTPEDYTAQFALLSDLTAALSRLHDGLNRLRRLKRTLLLLPVPLQPQSDALKTALDAVENVLVDTGRKSPRDVLRHPAGLNDTLAALLAGIGISDTPPTASYRAVSTQVIAKVDAALAQLDALIATELATLDHAAKALSTPLLSP